MNCRFGLRSSQSLPLTTNLAARQRSLSTAAAAKTRIGFVGLGQMGYPMALNLLTRGTQPSTHEFIVHDAFPAASARFVAEAGTGTPVSVAASVGEVAERADVIVTMLPEGKHVRAVYKGLLGAVGKGTVLIDSSTIDVATAKEVAGWAREKDALMVDAPVSGGTPGAKAGTLTFMVGSPTPEAFEKVKPYLQHMGKSIVHCGLNGNGQVAKICNNMLLGITMIAAAETMNLGMRMGMDPKLLASIINTSSGRCWSTDTYNPVPGVMEGVPSSRDYEGGFGTTLMSKDMGLAVSAANDSKSAILLGGTAHAMYMMLARTEGYGKKDFSSVFKWMGGEKDAKK
ncbi:NAD binding domain of 6-phosphogluconate dehydrogenase-domain-containing protein [Blyttiomyces helicus]|uniref:3-hydroxyisobutyrate dehydrogenase n=1 Tax=Blyttiomyces helicus TaxID=388810 RepID=A0A4P9W2I9_9FUNG|nr:NAD binding domain of 6-phosphogluconate dehydrogenase-domain-containing protein [Blyttiomyces helicus]|eukprot:RKO85383.1 NAD binding domain of 6-phosphogluconate dehydrogenase-domain-containing protein [Blyttiomyces helicus]